MPSVPQVLPLKIALIETLTEPRRIYNRYELKVEDPSGLRPDKLILVADFARMGGGMQLRRAVSAEHAGRWVIAVYLQVSSLGHDLDQWALYDWTTGERFQDKDIEIWAEVETLAWSRWQTWEQVANGLIPNASGVYEVRQREAAERLMIGRSANLPRRLRYELVEGRRTWAIDEKFRAAEDLAQIEMRWALASGREAPFISPAEIEAELLRRYGAQFGQWPKYNTAQPHQKPVPRKAA